MPVALTSANFSEFIASSDKPVLVDFWATWCGPCKTVAPILDEIATERDDVVIAKVDVDVSPELASAFNVLGVPTLMIFDKGQPQWQTTGARPKEYLVKELEGILAST